MNPFKRYFITSKNNYYKYFAWYDGFGDSGINLTLAIWFNSADLITAKNEAYIAIKKVFDEAGIDIEGSSEEEILEASEVFDIGDGRYLIVEC